MQSGPVAVRHDPVKGLLRSGKNPEHGALILQPPTGLIGMDHGTALELPGQVLVRTFHPPGQPIECLGEAARADAERAKFFQGQGATAQGHSRPMAQPARARQGARPQVGAGRAACLRNLQRVPAPGRVATAWAATVMGDESHDPGAHRRQLDDRLLQGRGLCDRATALRTLRQGHRDGLIDRCRGQTKQTAMAWLAPGRFGLRFTSVRLQPKGGRSWPTSALRAQGFFQLADPPFQGRDRLPLLLDHSLCSRSALAWPKTISTKALGWRRATSSSSSRGHGIASMPASKAPTAYSTSLIFLPR